MPGREAATLMATGALPDEGDGLNEGAFTLNLCVVAAADNAAALLPSSSLAGEEDSGDASGKWASSSKLDEGDDDTPSSSSKSGFMAAFSRAWAFLEPPPPVPGLRLAPPARRGSFRLWCRTGPALLGLLLAVVMPWPPRGPLGLAPRPLAGARVPLDACSSPPLALFRSLSDIDSTAGPY